MESTAQYWKPVLGSAGAVVDAGAAAVGGGSKSPLVIREFSWQPWLILSRARRQRVVHAILPCFLSWRKSLKKPPVSRKVRLQALKSESDLAERDLIRSLLALPPEKRTHFLRKRVGMRMSCL
jgi:hypothetical protein